MHILKTRAQLHVDRIQLLKLVLPVSTLAHLLEEREKAVVVQQNVGQFARRTMESME